MAKKLKLELIIDDKGTVAVKQFGDTAEKELKDVGRAVDKIDKKAKSNISTWKGLIAVVGGFFAISKMKSWAREWINLAGQQQQSTASMEQAMRSMGRYTPELYNQLIQVAGGLQKVTTFGDEATIEGQKFLLTYKNITDDLLPKTSAVMLDLAALMGGDTRQAANMLGKASMGLAGELRRVGITIDEDIAKSGDFAAILGEIEKQVGGQAQALAKGGYGGLQQLGNLLGDAKEKLGDFLLLFMEAGVSDELRKLLVDINEGLENWIKNNEDLIRQKVPEYIENIKDALSAVKDVLDAISPVIKFIADNWRLITGFGGWIGTYEGVKNLIKDRRVGIGVGPSSGIYIGLSKSFLDKKPGGKPGAGGGVGGDARDLFLGLSPEYMAALSGGLDYFSEKTKTLSSNISRDMGKVSTAIANIGKNFKETETVSDKFFGGMEKGLQEHIKQWTDWAAMGEQVTNDMLWAVQSNFQTMLFDFLKGEYVSLEEAWESLLDSMLWNFTQILSQIAAAWAASGIARLLGVSLPGFGFGGAAGGAAGAALTGGGLIGKLKGLLPGGAGAATITASQSAAIAAGMDVGAGGAAGAGGGGLGLSGAASVAAPFLAQLAGMELLSQIAGGPSFIGSLISPQKSYMPVFPAGSPEYAAQQKALAYAAEHPYLSSVNPPIHIESLIKVEGSLIADEATMERFTDEIDVRLQRLAEQRF